MSDIGWLVVMYIIGVLYILSPWVAVTYMLQSDKKVKKVKKNKNNRLHSCVFMVD